MVTTVNGLDAPSPTDALYSVADTITRLRDALAAAQAGPVVPGTGWTKLAPAQFTAPFTTYTGLNDGLGMVYRIVNGIVWCNGAIVNPNTWQGGANPFTMPVGARPAVAQVMATPSALGSGSVIVRPNGVVSIYSVPSQPGGTAIPLSLAYPLGGA